MNKFATIDPCFYITSGSLDQALGMWGSGSFINNMSTKVCSWSKAYSVELGPIVARHNIHRTINANPTYEQPEWLLYSIVLLVALTSIQKKIPEGVTSGVDRMPIDRSICTR